MDQLVLTRAREIFGETFKTYVSPQGTVFIEGVIGENNLMISYYPTYTDYIILINSVPHLVGIDSERVGEFLESLS